jgi:hypothetical protein
MGVDPAGRAPGSPPKLFSPSLAGQCLRYAVMEVRRFGRLIDPAAQRAMRDGVRRHQDFQQELHRAYTGVRHEVRLINPEWGVSGRIDAVLETAQGPWILEYKTVNHEHFVQTLRGGPAVAHWAQLQLYLAVGNFQHGLLVVEDREGSARVAFEAARDVAWRDWLVQRIQAVQRYSLERALPPREVSLRCLGCDRWRRCYRSPEDLQARVAHHPDWSPEPMVPRVQWIQQLHREALEDFLIRQAGGLSTS